MQFYPSLLLGLLAAFGGIAMAGVGFAGWVHWGFAPSPTKGTSSLWKPGIGLRRFTPMLFDPLPHLIKAPAVQLNRRRFDM